MIHDLKIRTQWLARVKSGEKRFELRKHDRDYQVGDVLHLTEVNDFGSPIFYPESGDESEGPDRGHNTFDVRVLHVLDGRQADGIDDDYCLLSIAPASHE
ncbi:DUF3850 domain-containing protein [Cellulomonas sp. ACRRI]|uniref:DUF3850 domain-containing protein n=1 Tax=Cellulomonas sp. ACRRI TaxID=2918188 RepID=UPI001EF207BC|nr:DUF3850 domain-containing protein [Cellulomonas sp. ACRRI]MCG7285392.1 DUF3850 domain-containing protein [Cellulomonas sp. ACRRI]